jgi:DNA-binding transcriptional ArsR family regulator
MTAALSPLQVVAQEVNGCLLLLDHHRKTGGGDAADAILDVSGSTAKPAIADAVLGLYKEQGRAGAVLHATGRDIPEVRLRLAFDAVTGAWQCTGDADAAVIGDTKQRILDYLDSVGSASVRDVAEAVGLDKGNAHKRLSDLVAAGLVRRASDGKQGVRYGLSEARQLQQQRQL